MRSISLKWLDNKDCTKSLNIAAYLLVFNVIPLLFSKKNKAVSFHAKQGFVQMLVWLLVPYALLIPLIGWVVGALLAVILRVESDIGFIPLFFRPFVHLLAQAAGVVPLLFFHRRLLTALRAVARFNHQPVGGGIGAGGVDHSA